MVRVQHDPTTGSAPSAPPSPGGRQPIWTRDGDLVGHEYLYRTRRGHRAGVDGWRAERQDVASAHVLESVAAAGRLAGPRLAFVNITRSFLVQRLPLPQPSGGRLVLEIVESVEADDGVLAGMQRLREMGYRLAIDDYVASDDQQAMLPHVDFVKIDVRDLPGLSSQVLQAARSHGAQVVAEWLATKGLVDQAVRLGFDMLQGDALGAATTV
jgi:EAL and modified HD-GYP domain-containing signal transduction protein